MIRLFKGERRLGEHEGSINAVMRDGDVVCRRISIPFCMYSTRHRYINLPYDLHMNEFALLQTS